MKNFISAIILFLFTFNSIGQSQVLYEKKNNETYQLRFQISTDASQENVNFIIRKLSESIPKNLYTTIVNLSMLQQITVTRYNIQVNANVSFSNMVFSGDYYYRGFSMADALFPSKISMEARFKNTAGQILASYSMAPGAFDPQNNIFSFDYIDSSRSSDIVFEVVTKKLIYDDYNKNLFIARIKAIDDYYSSEARMKLAMRDLAGINPQNLDFLYDYDKTLYEIGGLIAELESYNLDDALQLRSNDPLKYMSRLNELKLLQSGLSIAVKNALATLHEIYYNKGLENVVNDDLKSARIMFEKSLSANPAFTPSMLQLAKIDFRENKPEASVKRIIELINMPALDEKTRTLAFDLTSSIYSKYISDASSLNSQKKYTYAILLLEKAAELCRYITGFSCDNLLTAEMSRARTGIYNLFLQKSRTALTAKKLAEADQYVDSALLYQKSYPTEVSSNTEAIALQLEIKKAFSDKYIADGKTLLSAKKYEPALLTFQQVEKLEKNYQIGRNAELPSLLRKAASPVILAKADYGLALVLQNRVVEARNILDTIIDLQIRYTLDKDKAIMNKTTELESRLVTQECKNARNEFDQYLLNVRKYITEMKYAEADQEINKALKLADNNPKCRIPDTMAFNLRMKILPATTYLKIMTDVDALVKSGKFEKAVTTFLEADAYYSVFNVASFGLRNKALPDYAKMQGTAFVIYCVGYFNKNAEVDHAFAMLTELKQRLYPAKLLKIEQTQTGIALAKRDKVKNPSGVAKTLVLDYTAGDKWYNMLKKEYLKQWKAM